MLKIELKGTKKISGNEKGSNLTFCGLSSNFMLSHLEFSIKTFIRPQKIIIISRAEQVNIHYDWKGRKAYFSITTVKFWCKKIAQQSLNKHRESMSKKKYWMEPSVSEHNGTNKKGWNTPKGEEMNLFKLSLATSLSPPSARSIFLREEKFWLGKKYWGEIYFRIMRMKI